MLHVTELVEVFVLTCRHVVGNLEEPREEIIEERNQRRLAAEVQLQRLLFTTRREEDRGHLTKHVNVRASEAINRLLAIADDEKIRGPAAFRERQTFQQNTLYGVRV